MSVQSRYSFDARSFVRDAARPGGGAAHFAALLLSPLTALIAAPALSAGNRARDQARWPEAAAAYAKYLRLKPASADIWVQFAHCVRESGNPAGAEEAYLRALELEPDNPDTVLHVGRVKLALNDPASAATYFERATAFASPSLDAAKELQALRESPADSALSAADKARDEKRWVEAIEAYETFLRLRPGAAHIWVQLGHALQESGKAHEAEKAYLKALELGPENPDTLLHLGRIKQALNDPAAAVHYFEQAAAYPSPSLSAWNELLALRPHSPAHPLPFSKKALEAGRSEAMEAFTSFLDQMIGDPIRKTLSDIKSNLDIAINEIEFVRRRTTIEVGGNKILAYLMDQSPIFVDRADIIGPAANVLDGRIYEQDNADVIMSFVRPDTVFLDLGANVGIFSLQVGRRVNGLGKVHAFEPQKQLSDLLRRSAVLNGLGDIERAGTIETHAIGVSDRNGRMGFVIPEGHLGGGHMKETQAGETVSVVRLDDFFGSGFTCDLIKIDVEGHELPALLGMERILAASSHVKVLFEKLGRQQGYETDIERFLGELGFNLYGVVSRATLIPLKKGDLAQWDGYALAAKIGDADLQELNRARFFIYPNQLQLQSAVIEEGILRCKGTVGHIAFHGPYWFLPRGQYCVRLHGELKGELAMTIASRFGYPLTTCEFAEGATSSYFALERDAVLFECVARPATAETELSLQRIEIIRL